MPNQLFHPSLPFGFTHRGSLGGRASNSLGLPSRWCCWLTIATWLNLALVGLPSLAQLPAFPGAEGGGMYATGGRNGDVYVVSTLNDSGAGSLRHAIDTAPFSGRMIVFSVGGTIDLSSDLVINSPNITLAGQTAPTGITLARRALRISNTRDVIVQHIAVRPGDTNTAPNVYEPDSIWVSGSNDVILDHVSASWATDETVSVTHGSSNVTVQWSLITEALHNSNHNKGNHGYGSIFEAGETTLHHNLYAHNRSRNPRLAGADAPGVPNRADVVNNVIYNPGDRYSYSGSSDVYEVNFTGNYGIEGPSTTRENELLHPDSLTSQVYYAGNYYDTNEDGILQLTPASSSTLTGTFTSLSSAVPTAHPPQQTDAPTAYAQVLSYAGSAAHRDPIDKRVINSVLRQTGTHLDSQSEVGGWYYPTEASMVVDPDGLPDWWKMEQGLDPNDNTIGMQRPTPGGYTYLEHYLHELNEPFMPRTHTRAFTVSTAYGNGADAQVGEVANSATGSGDSPQLNARWTGTSGDSNELILLRFDLSQVELGSVANASLDLTAYGDAASSTLRVYGLDHEASNQVWSESSIDFSTAPGLAFDANSGTRSLATDEVLLLGEFTIAGASDGELLSFTNPDLVAFLNTLAYRQQGDPLVTLLLERQQASSAPATFASKEATQLGSGSTVAAGTLAPRLTLEAVPDATLLPGNYNDDGQVDLADYAVWRNNLNAAPGTLANDTVGGGIGTVQYEVWRANFAANPATESVGAESVNTAAAVPEPRGIALALVALLGMAWGRVRL